MDFLEKIYEREIDLKNSVELVKIKLQAEEDFYYEYKKRMVDCLKTKEQKTTFETFDFYIEDRIKNYSKELFLTGFNYGLKMGIEANNSFNKNTNT